ncbi:DUF456 domain-containing protein [Kribbia dieselivorans]|uniref:DUF456 domain-containing protein n=1 Tax=Kribbia dieselivorans TaxID=331526 RepID=UPI0009FA6518|nr:DUF456 domain-containing protein [Kribbia dieselivorans]
MTSLLVHPAALTVGGVDFLPGAAGWLIPALLFVVGVFGIIVPVLPGLVLCVASVGLWALDNGSSAAWWAFGIAVALYVAGVVLQVVLPGRRMKRDGVSNWALLSGVVGGIVGFFVIPVFGAPPGFVLGIFVYEFVRHQDLDRAWSATKAALRGVLHSMGIELATALAVAIVWVGGIIVAA